MGERAGTAPLREDPDADNDDDGVCVSHESLSVQPQGAAGRVQFLMRSYFSVTPPRIGILTKIYTVLPYIRYYPHK